MCYFSRYRYWPVLLFLSIWDLASTGFLIGFSVFCTDYGQYWFSKDSADFLSTGFLIGGFSYNWRLPVEPKS